MEEGPDDTGDTPTYTEAPQVGLALVSPQLISLMLKAVAWDWLFTATQQSDVTALCHK